MSTIEKDKEKFIKMAEKIAESGGRMYLVGGAVRDMVLGKKPHDMDFCVTGISPEKLKELFPKARVQGKAFPVFVIYGSEFALARKEKKSGEKHTDFDIMTDESISIEEDLARRDFTINSMALDMLDKRKIIDPYGGQDDLKNGILRAITESFKEDPLRVYRAARFASQLGFSVDEKTLEIMKAMKEELLFLSVERVNAELRKALLTEHPEAFFKVLKSADVLDIHFPEIAMLMKIKKPDAHHPEQTAYEHTMKLLQEAVKRTPKSVRYLMQTAKEQPLKRVKVIPKKNYQISHMLESDPEGGKISRRELIRFGALVQDFGKLTVGSENNATNIVRDFCKRLKLANVFERAGTLAVEEYSRVKKYEELTSREKVQLFERIEKSGALMYRDMELLGALESSKRKKEFAEIAEEVMKVRTDMEMKKQCRSSNGQEMDYEKLKELLLKKKISVLEKIEKKDIETK